MWHELGWAKPPFSSLRCALGWETRPVCHNLEQGLNSMTCYDYHQQSRCIVEALGSRLAKNVSSFLMHRILGGFTLHIHPDSLRVPAE